MKQNLAYSLPRAQISKNSPGIMNRREIPIDIWRKRLVDNTRFTGNGVVLTVVPDINIGDTDFRLLPDAVFEACTRFVVDFYGHPSKRDVFGLFYSAKLEENQAATINKRIIDAEADRKRIQESSGLSFAQEVNFRKEIEGNALQLLSRRAEVTRRQEIIRKKIVEDPEFEERLKECEVAYNELLLLAVQSDEDNQSLDFLRAIDPVQELIGRNIYEYQLPPINLD